MKVTPTILITPQQLCPHITKAALTAEKKRNKNDGQNIYNNNNKLGVFCSHFKIQLAERPACHLASSWNFSPIPTTFKTTVFSFAKAKYHLILKQSQTLLAAKWLEAKSIKKLRKFGIKQVDKGWISTMRIIDKANVPSDEGLDA